MSEARVVYFLGRRDRRARPLVRAFTLIELMMVVALIGVLAAGLALALGDTGGNSLATGQTTLASLVNTARAQAAVNQTETRLLIYATRPPAQDAAEKFLRLLQVVRAETPGSTARWVPVGGAVALPRGIFVVPPSTAGFLTAGVVWPTNPPLLSTLGGPITHGQPTGTPFGTAQAYFVEFKADGTVTQVGAQQYARLLVATATNGPTGPLFNNNAAVRGLLIRPSGAVTFVNDATNF